MHRMKIAVIGAGPMGLVCALELLKSGHSVEIFEYDDRIGGMSASFDFDGLQIERYYHFICKSDHTLFKLLRELGIENRLRWTDTRMGFYCNGSMYPWGNPSALLTFDQLNFLDKLRYAAHVMYTKNVRNWRKLDQINAIDWLKRWLGERGYRVLWERLFHLKFYQYSKQLSAAWLGTRIKRVALSRRSLMQETLGYLDGGSETLLDALRDKLESLGGRIHLRTPVSRLIVSGNAVKGIEAGDATFEFDQVLSTVPIQFVPRLAPDLPASFIDKIERIENIPVVCVILKLREPLSRNFWTNICDPEVDIPGLIEYSNLNHAAGPAIVYAPFYMPKTHPKYKRPDEAFVDEVLSYLPRINPDFRRDWVLGQHCHRYAFAQTVCPPGFYDMLPSMRTPIAGFFMCDTAYYYPEDRSISESARLGMKLARTASREICPDGS